MSGPSDSLKSAFQIDKWEAAILKTSVILQYYYVLGEVIKTGDIKQVQGEGMPHYRNPFEKGRMLIQFNVVFPPNLDPAMADALSKILPPV